MAYKDCIININSDDADIISWYNSYSKKASATAFFKSLVFILISGKEIGTQFQLTHDFQSTSDKEIKKIRFSLPEEMSEWLNTTRDKVNKDMYSTYSRGDIAKAIIRESFIYPSQQLKGKLTNQAISTALNFTNQGDGRGIEPQHSNQATSKISKETSLTSTVSIKNPVKEKDVDSPKDEEINILINRNSPAPGKDARALPTARQNNLRNKFLPKK